MTNPGEPVPIDQYIDCQCPNCTPAGAGCWQCGTQCPWTNDTQPPLTRQLANIWFDAHKQICPAQDWPGAEITWEGKNQ